MIGSAHLHILQHALGVDQYGRGDQYRSHFVTGEGSEDHSACIALAEAGLMTRRAGSSLPFGGDDLFHVTDAGRDYVAEHSPPPPKGIRSKSRYAQYLDADVDHPFGEWLRRRSYKPEPGAAMSGLSPTLVVVDEYDDLTSRGHGPRHV